MKKLKSWVWEAFPHREECPHCNEKKYSWNEMNRTVRAAILRNVNTIKSLPHEKEKDEETQEEA